MGLNGLMEFCNKNAIDCKINEPMNLHTSFKIGGAADTFININSANQLADVIKFLNKNDIPHFIIGKGSNLLVSDKGIEGAVISLLKMNSVAVSGEEIICDAGAALSDVCRAACDNCLSGLEFAYGIPGSVGGAVFMNAGAYGGEMKDVTLSADCLTEEGEIITVDASDMHFGYRKSIFKSENMIVLSVKLGLKKGVKSEIEAKMQDFICRRRDKQPLEWPSAGSFFKRPEGNFAGALIEKNGLKGYSVGDAKVSEKHAGFVINCGKATCEDVKKLRCDVVKKVFEADGITLEPEVIFVGRE